MEAGMSALRKLVGGMLAFAALGLVTGIAARAEDRLSGDLRVAVNGWIIQKFPVQAAAQDFMKRHPGVKVEVIPNDDDTFVNQYLLEWAHGHNPADLGIGGTPGQLAAFVAKDYLAPWTDFFTGAFAKDKFITSYLDSGVFKGVQYSLPFMGEVIMFSVNKPLLQKAGLLGTDGQAAPPANWGGLVEFCKKLTAANGGKPGCSLHWGFSFATYDYLTCLLGEQGTFYEQGTRVIDFSSPAAHDCIAVGRELIADGSAMPETVSDDNGGRRVFVAGGVGALLEAASREAEAAAKQGADKVGLMAVPGTEKNGTIVFSHALYLPKADSANARMLAIAFVREEILTPAFGQPGLEHFGKLPTYLPAWSGLEGDPTYKLELAVVAHGVNAPNYAGYDRLDTAIQQQIGKAVLGSESVDDALKALQGAIRTVDLTDLSAAH
jgi:multiple sugar transport system substrate-binding protein